MPFGKIEIEIQNRTNFAGGQFRGLGPVESDIPQYPPRAQRPGPGVWGGGDIGVWGGGLLISPLGYTYAPLLVKQYGKQRSQNGLREYPGILPVTSAKFI